MHPASMVPRSTALALASLFLLAGCLGGVGDDPEPTDVANASSTSAATDGGAGSNATAIGVRLLPVEEAGTLPAGAHAQGLTAAPTGTFDRWFEMEVDGTVTEASLTMTWEATNPTMETLLLGFGPRSGSGADAHATDEAVYVTGTSPLELTIEDVAWTGGDYVAWAWWDPGTDPQASPIDQPFEIEGSLTQAST